MKKIICAPSLLAVFEGKGYDRNEIRTALKDAITLTPSASWYHIDVMDGIFVPQKTSFFTDKRLTADISTYTKALLDVHLMVDDPKGCLDQFGEAASITFHYEATQDPLDIINAIASRGHKVGISINPKTPLETIYPFLPDLDLVLLMSVVPGRCGQSYHPEIDQKIHDLKEKIETSGLECLIQVDGGIKKQNCSNPLSQGADILVIGSGVYQESDPDGVIRAVEDPILIGADHGGIILKEKIKRLLETRSQPYIDLGTYTNDSCDHPLIAERVARPISENRYSRGILVCGTGIGMSIGANRFPQVRAAILYPAETPGFSLAEMSRSHNDSNIAILGERSMDHDRALRDLGSWLDLPGPSTPKYLERNKQFDTYRSH